MQPTQKELSLDRIEIEGGTQPRVRLDQLVVAEYAEQIKEGVAFPPVDVFFDGSKYWLADGFHRYFGHRQAGAEKMPALVRPGTQRDAVLSSCGANPSHGLRRSSADKRKAVTTLLQDAEWSKWTDREIARKCRVGADLVGKVRQELSVGNDRCAPVERTFSRGGTTSTMKTGNIGRKPKATAPEAKPGHLVPPPDAATVDRAATDQAAPAEHVPTSTPRDVPAVDVTVDERMAGLLTDVSLLLDQELRASGEIYTPRHSTCLQSLYTIRDTWNEWRAEIAAAAARAGLIFPDSHDPASLSIRTASHNLRDWCAWWNGLHARGLVSHGVNEQRPNEGIRAGWKRVERNAELRELLGNRERLEFEIAAGQKMCQEGWFALEKLFGAKNKDGQLIVQCLLDGRYRDRAEASVAASLSGFKEFIEANGPFGAVG